MNDVVRWAVLASSHFFKITLNQQVIFTSISFPKIGRRARRSQAPAVGPAAADSDGFGTGLSFRSVSRRCVGCYAWDVGYLTIL